MAFQNLSLFNQAMLAKIVWKLWIQPNSLVAKILKYKYYKRVDILMARKRTKKSYMWKVFIGEESSLVRVQPGQSDKAIR